MVRLITLCLALLVAGTVWAGSVDINKLCSGEQHCVSPNPPVSYDLPGKSRWLGNMTMEEYDRTHPTHTPCERQMEEAMKQAAPYAGLAPPNGKFVEAEYQAMKQQWDATATACWKGGR